MGLDTGTCHSRTNIHTGDIIGMINTGQFKKKVTLPHVHNEATSEPTITRFSTIVTKTLKVCL
jgi:hypothetical protein